MNNNIDIRAIKKNLGEVSGLFDPNKPTYKILTECANDENITSDELVKKLSTITDSKDYPMELRNYFYKTIKDLDYLNEKDKEIERLQNDIVKENDELMAEMKKRNVDYYEPLQFNNDYKNLTYNEKQEYIEKLKNDLENLKSKNLSLKENEKKLGEEFSEELIQKTESNDLQESQMDEKMEKINKEALETKFLANPPLDELKRNYEFMKNYQTDNSKLNVEVNYKNDGNIEVSIGYKGTEVNEKYPLVSINYTDIDYFNKEILPFLVNEHVEDGVKDKDQTDEQIESENSYDETLSIAGNKDVVENTSQTIENHMNYYIDNKEKVNINKPKVLVRKLDNSAYSNSNVYIILFIVFLVIIIITVIFILFK